MSINISDKVMRMAVNNFVSIDIDLSRFGPIQAKRFHKMVLTGAIDGDTTAARLARTIREQHNLPHAGFVPYSGYKWKAVEKGHELFTKLKAAVTLHQLTNGLTEGSYWRSNTEALIRAIEMEEENGKHYVFGDNCKKILGAVHFGSNSKLEALVSEMKSNHITTYALQYS